MNPLHDRIRQRLSALGKSARAASIDSALSEYTVTTLLKKPGQSQTLETITKLAIGLETTPEWLAFGITESAPQATRDLTPLKISSTSGEAPVHIDRLQDSESIQVSIGDLRKASLQLLRRAHLLRRAGDEDEDDAALVAGLLATLARRPNAYAVRRLTASDHNRAGPEAPAYEDQL